MNSLSDHIRKSLSVISRNQLLKESSPFQLINFPTSKLVHESLYESNFERFNQSCSREMKEDKEGMHESMHG